MGIVSIHKLDTKPYSVRLRQMREMANQSLQKYGEPRIPLADLRRAVDKRLVRVSLCDKILEERQAGM